MSRKTSDSLYYQRHKEKIRTRAITTRQIFPERSLLMRAKNRGKEFNIPFNITIKDLLPLPINCPILGIKLVYNSIGGRKENSASLDRIHNTKGYVKGNIAIISDKANRLKNNGTLEDFKKIVNYLENNSGRKR